MCARLRRLSMPDTVLLLLGLAFFAIAAVYLLGCERA
jgi:hypothetical protein